MTKEVLISRLQNGEVLEVLLPLTDGQDCLIYKADSFSAGDNILYIPDVFLNKIPYDQPCTSEEDIRAIISRCYTGEDFLLECNGCEKSAAYLFSYCDWQHPSSAIDEIEEIDPDTGKWRDTIYA